MNCLRLLLVVACVAMSGTHGASAASSAEGIRAVALAPVSSYAAASTSGDDGGVWAIVRRGVANFLAGIAGSVLGPEALNGGANAVVDSLVEPAITNMLPKLLPDPYEIGSFTYSKADVGIPLCSKMEFAADAGTVTGLKHLKLDGIDVLKVNASYDKRDAVSSTMRIQMSAPDSDITLKGMKGNITLACKLYSPHGTIAGDIILSGVEVNSTVTTVLDLTNPLKPKLKCLKVDKLDIKTKETKVDITTDTVLKAFESKIENLLSAAMSKILTPLIEKAIPAATKVATC